MLDLALLLHLRHEAELLLGRDLVVDAVQLPEVDLLDVEPAQAHLDALPQVLGAPDRRPDVRAGAGEAALGGDGHAVVRRERFADEVLADVRAVAVGGVDEVDAQLDGAAQDGAGGVEVRGRTPDAGAGDAHGTEAEAVDLEVAAETEGAGGADRGGAGGHAAPRVRGCGGSRGCAVAVAGGACPDNSFPSRGRVTPRSRSPAATSAPPRLSPQESEVDATGERRPVASDGSPPGRSRPGPT